MRMIGAIYENKPETCGGASTDGVAETGRTARAAGPA